MKEERLITNDNRLILVVLLEICILELTSYYGLEGLVLIPYSNSCFSRIVTFNVRPC